MKLTTHDVRDPGGKAVDIFPSDGQRKPDPVRGRPRHRSRGAGCTHRRAASRARGRPSNPVLSDRDFPVWFVQVPERAEIPALTGLGRARPDVVEGLPPAARPARRSMDAFWTSPSKASSSTSMPSRCCAIRTGSVIAYGDEFEPRPRTPCRTASTSCAAPRRRATSCSAARARARRRRPWQDGREHTLESWAQASSQVEEWIAGLWDPLSFAALRDAVEGLGIAVHDEPDAASVGKYGCIRTGWRFADDACTVRILLAPHHHDDLKYAILAHELGHYCRHFPHLHHAQLRRGAVMGDPGDPAVLRHARRLEAHLRGRRSGG